MLAPRDEIFQVGVVTGTHGLHGDLKVRPLTSGSLSLLEAETVYLRRPGEEPAAFRPKRAVPHKGNILLRLEGLEDINRVQHLVGCEVLMSMADLEELPEGEHYWFELKGLQVVDRSWGEIGTLEDLFTTAAHDVYVVRGEFGEVLIPAVEEFIVEIDLEARRMLVDLPAGLIREPDEV